MRKKRKSITFTEPNIGLPNRMKIHSGQKSFNRRLDTGRIQGYLRGYVGEHERIRKSRRKKRKK